LLIIFCFFSHIRLFHDSRFHTSYSSLIFCVFSFFSFTSHSSFLIFFISSLLTHLLLFLFFFFFFFFLSLIRRSITHYLRLFFFQKGESKTSY
jgi:hypothetical protein